MNRKQELDRLRAKGLRATNRGPFFGPKGEAEGCPECVETAARVEVYWDADGNGETYEVGPEFCPACGRRLVIDIYWPVEERG